MISICLFWIDAANNTHYSIDNPKWCGTIITRNIWGTLIWRLLPESKSMSRTCLAPRPHLTRDTCPALGHLTGAVTVLVRVNQAHCRARLCVALIPEIWSVHPLPCKLVGSRPYTLVMRAAYAIHPSYFASSPFPSPRSLFCLHREVED